MFQQILRDVVENTDGCVAALIMGYDGIALELCAASGDQSAEVFGMEFSVILRDIRRAAEMVDAGQANEVVIGAEKLQTVIRLLNQDYFVALTLAPGGNIGKGRYLLRLAAPKLVDALS